MLLAWVHAAEVAQLLARSVNYEIPSVKKQIAKSIHSQQVPPCAAVCITCNINESIRTSIAVGIKLAVVITAVDIVNNTTYHFHHLSLVHYCPSR